MTKSLKTKLIYMFSIVLVILGIITALIVFPIAKKNNQTYEPKTFFVNFNIGEDIINGEYFTKTSVIEGNKLEDSNEIPNAVNKYFAGWYLDESYQKEVEFPLDITKDTTLYAKFIEANLPSSNIGYDEIRGEYFITGVLSDQTIENLVIPDAYDDGVNGAKPLTFIKNVNNITGLLTNNKKISKLVIGNNISTILEYFAYNSVNLENVTFGKFTTSIAGSAFGKCTAIKETSSGPSSNNWWDLSHNDLIDMEVDWIVGKFVYVMFDPTNRLLLNDETENYGKPVYADSDPTTEVNETEEEAKVAFRRQQVVLHNVATGETVTETTVDRPSSFPTTVNYRFLGWGLDPDPTNLDLVDFETHTFSGKKNIVLYAKYLEGNVDGFLGYKENYAYTDGTTENVYYVKKSTTNNSSTNNNFASYTTTDVVIPDIYNDGSNGLAKVGYIEGNTSGNYYYGILYKDTKMTGTLYVGNYVRYIGESFAGNSSIGAIEFSDYVLIDVIDTEAFYNCDNLTELYVNARGIKYRAFYGLAAVTMVTLGENVENLGRRSFGGLDNATTLNYNSINAIYKDNDEDGSVEQAFCYFGRDVYTNEGITVTINVGKNVKYIPQRFADNDDGINIRFESIVFDEDCVCESIGGYAFRSLTSLIEIVNFPNTIKSIGAKAFMDSSNLQDFNLSESLETISESAFRYCSGLENVQIPESVTYIGEYSFDECSLKEIRIGTNVKTIESHAFSDNFSVNTIYYNAINVENYSTSAFTKVGTGAVSVTVTIGKDVEVIPDKFMKNASDGVLDCIIQKLIFEEGSKLKSIGYQAFRYQPIGYTITEEDGTERLADLILPDTLETIGEEAFRGNSEDKDERADFRKVHIPDSVKTVGEGAFTGCRISEIYVGKNVESFGRIWLGSTVNEFYWNVANDNISFEATNNSLHDNTIENFIIGKDVVKIPNNMFYYTDDLSNTNRVRIYNITYDTDYDSKLEEIGDNAFRLVKNVKSITLPNTLKEIGAGSFYGFSKYTTNSTDNTSFTMPDSVTTIGDSAFARSTFTNFAINNTITNISNTWFSNATISNSFTIGENVKTIEDGALEGLRGKIIFNAIAMNDLSLTNGIFDNVNYYVEFGDKVMRIPSNLFGSSSNCTIAGDVVIPNSVITIGDNAFYNCTQMTSLVIGNNVETIGSYAFNNCRALTEINIPNSVITIGDYVFYEDNSSDDLSVTSITIGEGVEEIGVSAFGKVSELTTLNYNAINCNDFGTSSAMGIVGATSSNFTLNIGDKVEKIPAYLLYGLKVAGDVVIPDSVTTIGDYAFYNCTSITSLTVGAKVNTIGVRALAGQTGLKTINWNATACEDLTESSEIFYKSSNSSISSTNQTPKMVIGKNVEKIPAYLLYANVSATYKPRFYSVVFEADSKCNYIGKHAFDVTSSRITNVDFGNNTEDWTVSDSKAVGTQITEDLSNKTTAKTCLTTTYVDKYWIRQVVLDDVIITDIDYMNGIVYWTAVEDATSYDIYVDDICIVNVSYQGEDTKLSLDFSTFISDYTAHYVGIVAKNDEGASGIYDDNIAQNYIALTDKNDYINIGSYKIYKNIVAGQLAYVSYPNSKIKWTNSFTDGAGYEIEFKNQSYISSYAYMVCDDSLQYNFVDLGNDFSCEVSVSTIYNNNGIDADKIFSYLILSRDIDIDGNITYFAYDFDTDYYNPYSVHSNKSGQYNVNNGKGGIETITYDVVPNKVYAFDGKLNDYYVTTKEELFDIYYYAFINRITQLDFVVPNSFNMSWLSQDSDGNGKMDLIDYIGETMSFSQAISYYSHEANNYVVTIRFVFTEYNDGDIQCNVDYYSDKGITINTYSQNFDGRAYYENFDYDTKGRRTSTYDNFVSDKSLIRVEVSTTEELRMAVEAGYTPICKPGSRAEEIYNIAKEVLREIISDSMTEFEKAITIFDWICLNTTYDYTATNLGSPHNSQDVPAFYLEGVFMNNLAVCDGFSKAYSLLCNMEGIDCYKVSGTAGSGANVGGHAWNKVKVDGNWYIVDITWTEQSVNGKEYLARKYFLVTDSFIASDHFENSFQTEKYNIKSATTPYDIYSNIKFGSADLYINSEAELIKLVEIYYANNWELLEIVLSHAFVDQLSYNSSTTVQNSQITPISNKIKELLGSGVVMYYGHKTLNYKYSDSTNVVSLVII